MNTTNTTLLLQMTFDGISPAKVDEVDMNTTYVGFCKDSCKGVDDPTWLIKRIKKEGTEQTITFANGKKKYTQKWSERYDLDYKITEFEITAVEIEEEND